jgi:hypothetical protein
VEAALAGAALGGLIAFVATLWGMRLARRAAEAEAARQEIAVLEGFISEIELSKVLADRASPTALPVEYLHAAMPLYRTMDAEQLSILRTYSQAVLRYNGRVTRIIEYGAAKRAAGESPGSEKPESHAKEVQEAVPAARDKLMEVVNERSRRLAEASLRRFLTQR